MAMAAFGGEYRSEHQNTEIVTVFVRKGKDEDTRFVSFNGPIKTTDAVDDEALTVGLTKDGRTYCYLVTPFTHVGRAFRVFPDGEQRALPLLYEAVDEKPLMGVLHDVECALRDWLAGKNLLVYFA